MNALKSYSAVSFAIAVGLGCGGSGSTPVSTTAGE
jgi:hypothetical protein